MAVGFTFTVEKECPVCSEKTKVTRTRSRLIKVSQDYDFCVRYKDFNPYYYSIWVCSHCGYAADEAYFERINEINKEKIAAFLKQKEVKMEYKEERTRDEAIAAYKLAIFFADLVNSKPNRMAGLYLKLAWLYREAGDEAKENEILPRALEYYDKSLTTERYPIGNMTDNAVMYLIGALHYKTGNIEQATQYLSRVVGNENVRDLEPNIFIRARDLWQDIRKERDLAKAAAK